jgi:hypothetical protein
MDFGSPKGIDFSKYLSFKFSPNIAHKWNIDNCGSNLVSMITGEHPETINRKYNNNREGWSTRSVIRYLKKREISCFPLNISTMIDTAPHHQNLKNTHVVIANIRISTRINSWFLIYRDKFWHNFNTCEFTYGPLFFLNKPPQDVILLWKEEWA